MFVDFYIQIPWVYHSTFLPFFGTTINVPIPYVSYLSLSLSLLSLSLFPSMGLYVSIEPSDDWTVEQALQWWLLHAQSETDAKYLDHVTALTAQLEKGKAELWECHQQVVETLNQTNQDNNGTKDHKTDPSHTTANNNENADPQYVPLDTANTIKDGKATTAVTATTTMTMTSHMILVEIVGGEHAGTSYQLRPKQQKAGACWIGRSTGKKFREKGISLPRDLEVSTTHGKFELIRGKYYFTDTGSTNGSRCGGQELLPDTPLELENGMEIIIGQTIMRITLS